MPQIFPLVADAENPDYAIRVVLDATTYVCRFRWSEREACWYFDLLDDQEDPIRVGVKVVLDWPLFSRVRDSRRPAGAIMARDTTDAKQGPGIDELGGRVILVYYSRAEMLDLLALAEG